MGDRNRQFAQECVRRIAEQSLQVAVLKGDSDGIDGHSPEAGAVSDEKTLASASIGIRSADGSRHLRPLSDV
jgi:glycerate-2-kinase